eukprot:3933523-Rhodomonas_salina.2
MVLGGDPFRVVSRCDAVPEHSGACVDLGRAHRARPVADLGFVVAGRARLARRSVTVVTRKAFRVALIAVGSRRGHVLLVQRTRVHASRIALPVPNNILVETRRALFADAGDAVAPVPRGALKHAAISCGEHSAASRGVGLVGWRRVGTVVRAAAVRGGAARRWCREVHVCRWRVAVFHIAACRVARIARTRIVLIDCSVVALADVTRALSREVLVGSRLCNTAVFFAQSHCAVACSLVELAVIECQRAGSNRAAA